MCTYPREFVLSRRTTFHGQVSGQEGKTRAEILKNGLPIEPCYLVSPTLTSVLRIRFGRYDIPLDVIFVIGADDRVADVDFYSPYLWATKERGYLEVAPTESYWRLPMAS